MIEKQNVSGAPDMELVKAAVAKLEEQGKVPKYAEDSSGAVDRILTQNIDIVFLDEKGDDVESRQISLSPNSKSNLIDFASKVGLTGLNLIHNNNGQIDLEIREGDSWFRVLNLPNQLNFEPKYSGDGFLLNNRPIGSYSTDVEFGSIPEKRLEKGFQHPRARHY